ncbi:NUDIX hydrolase [Vibrio tritonius]|uniref:NUDIX hydrolase n=1 Tax=Vibrio tritonius TaxID=1435069 RepID=A0ABS7YRF7_9VIBR|nr:NUDIX hydrolase [Vibrio tritonius]MCA2018270.1 NUDIX hydrolase [Vibrio tritonius]
MKNLSMAVVIKGSTVLVQQRYRVAKGMVYEFPGGCVEDDESGEFAAIRELWEETGVSGVRKLGEYTCKNQFGGDSYYVVMEPAAEIFPTANAPEKSLHWVPISDIPRDNLYPADKEFVEQYLPDYM